MSHSKVSDRLLRRLREDGIIPRDAVALIARTNASGSQRVYGAWSWFASWDDGHKEVGSQFTMLDCLRAPRLDRSRWEYGQMSLDPDPVPPRRPR